VDESSAPELYRIVSQLTREAGLPMPKIYIIPNPAPNAFATGRNPEHAAVAVTEGILRLLDERQLRGVLAHELSHVQNRDILIGTIAAGIAGAIMILARIAQFCALFGGGGDRRRDGDSGLGLLVMAIVMPIAALLIQMAISRSREYQADASGGKLSGDPRALAQALARLQEGTRRIPMQADPATSHLFIVSPFSGGGLVSLFSTHPPIQERVARLEAQADAMGR
jgi:heat shock protein HtpX